MASKDREASDLVALQQALQDAPYDFDFFQAVRRLECAYDDKPRLGQSLKASNDPVRLAQQPSLRFAPAPLDSFEPGGQNRPPRLSVNFFGLLGPNGPLPLHLTEYAYERMHNAGDVTFARFLDVFHHRMLSFFYRAWANGRPTVEYDRPEADRFAFYVGALAGLRKPPRPDYDAELYFAQLHHAGRMSCQTRHAEGLSAMLKGFFRLPIKITQFVGHWLPLPEDCRCRLGGGASQAAALGGSATLGAEVWDCQSKFRIILGPVGYSDYQRFLPGTKSIQRMIGLLRQYIGDELCWDVNLLLKKDEVPGLRLGQLGQLGWTTWLMTESASRDAQDLVMEPIAQETETST